MFSVYYQSRRLPARSAPRTSDKIVGASGLNYRPLWANRRAENRTRVSPSRRAYTTTVLHSAVSKPVWWKSGLRRTSPSPWLDASYRNRTYSLCDVNAALYHWAKDASSSRFRLRNRGSSISYHRYGNLFGKIILIKGILIKSWIND